MRDLYDVHMHTDHSDGAKSPKELVELVRDSRVITGAITDHDTTTGAIEARNFIKPEDDFTLISGIELSSKSQKGTMHILGYYFDLFDEKFNHKLLELKQNRIKRAYYIFDYLRKKHGLSFDEGDIYNLIHQTNNIGRPHIAELCVRDGYANNVDDAFDKYLREVAKETQDFKLPPNECMSLILDAGGIPILAHPCKLKSDYEELRELVKKHMDYGLKGLEVYHSDHTREQIYEYMKIVKEFNLQYSVGSDFHGREDNLDVFIGSGRNNNLNVKEMTLHK